VHGTVANVGCLNVVHTPPRDMRGWALILLRAAFASACALMAAGCSSGPGSIPGAVHSADSALIQAIPTWDGNRDGTVTCEEWKSYADGLFKQFDGGKDGFLTTGEYRALAQADRLFEVVPLGYFDGDGDGRVSRSEFVDKPNRAFAMLDKNSDCALERDEFRQSSPPQPGGPGGRGMPKGGPGAGGPGGLGSI
jgi:hypothetical protein